jgi:hypothetical protein
MKTIEKKGGQSYNLLVLILIFWSVGHLISPLERAKRVKRTAYSRGAIRARRNSGEAQFGLCNNLVKAQFSSSYWMQEQFGFMEFFHDYIDFS